MRVAGCELAEPEREPVSVPVCVSLPETAIRDCDGDHPLEIRCRDSDQWQSSAAASWADCPRSLCLSAP